MGLFKHTQKTVLILLFFISMKSLGFSFPDVHFERLGEQGFRCYILDSPGIKNFKISLSINKDWPKDIIGGTANPSDGLWVINFNVAVKDNDVILYKADVDFNGRHYSRMNVEWTVPSADDLVKPFIGPRFHCGKALTITNGEEAKCAGELILLDEFDKNGVNTSIWTVEHKIPTYDGEHGEFNTYEDTSETQHVENGVLHIKPTVRTNEVFLNFTTGCTSNKPRQCTYNHQSSRFPIPPVKSARITSKISFQYGKIEVRAKFPSGDWLVPVIELTPKDDIDEDFSTSIVIARSNGNSDLTDLDNQNIGSQSLTVGLIHGSSRKLLSYQHNQPFYSDFHTYGLEWLQDKMLFYVDGIEFGYITNSNDFENTFFSKMYNLSIGLPVGGLTFFPDGSVSGNETKPWNDTEPAYVKKFTLAMSNWLPTWNEFDSVLKIDYVKVWSV